MLSKPKHGLFITGTDTEVGKTYVGSLIVKSLASAGYRVGAYKPVASGCISDGRSLFSEDAMALWDATGRNGTTDQVCPQRFKAALAPHLAAQAEGRAIDGEALRTGIEVWNDQCDIVVVEGVGGLMSPISADEYVADLALDLGYPLVIVVPNMLGAINQTLQTLITASCFRDGLPIAGIVINDLQDFESDVSVDSNEQQIASRTDVPILARAGYHADALDREVDWFALSSTTAET
ncbi:MAG: dethiobiotin synthase [Pirellulaceae bacterium]